uniref:SUMO specific peptidase 7b n=1 Tax=Dicentrarchus labrax TaxID=13489 RepID=A0A8C4H2I3_DICLA
PADPPPLWSGPTGCCSSTYPAAPCKGRITVTKEDLACLGGGEFLNDVIIDFYLKYLLLEGVGGPVAERSHVFSSFFYKQLSRRRAAGENDIILAQKRHQRVKTWTRHVDIFTKDFLFVPVNQEAHWYLVVVCFPGLEKDQYEDFQSPTGELLSSDAFAVFSYLQVEWEVRRATPRRFTPDNMMSSNCRVPQQDNSSDCGLYLLQYAESFLQNPVVHFNLPLGLDNWFPRQLVRQKREEIRSLIMRMHRSQTVNSQSLKDVDLKYPIFQCVNKFALSDSIHNSYDL